MVRSSDSARRHSRHGFTLTEVMLVGALMSVLVLLISGVWAALGRSTADTAARCRVAQEARLAAATLARDFSGSLPEQLTGTKQCGRLVGWSIAAGPQLRLDYDGEPDTTIVYELDTEITYGKAWKRLVRRNVNALTEFTAATNVDAMALTDLGDALKIDLTFTYRDVTRTHTIVARAP